MVERVYAAKNRRETAIQFRKALLVSFKKHVEENDSEEEGEPLTFAAHASRKSGIEIEELESFANNCQTERQKLLAAAAYSHFNDKFFGQWLVLHRPFRRIEE